MRTLMLALSLALTACETLPEGGEIETAGTTAPPPGCADLRKRKGDEAC